MKINGIILAAGCSNRLGQPKQLVKYKGLSLLQHTEKLISPYVTKLYVVTGHQSAMIQDEIKSASIVNNTEWQKGMGTSISCGVKAAHLNADAILLALCDQAKIPASHYQQLTTKAKHNKHKIITSAYANTHGVPAIFPQVYFPDLMQLEETSGAQSLIHKYKQDTLSILCETAAFDVDTTKDLKNL